jgi:hypothetical protein
MNWLMGLMLQAYLHRDRLHFAMGLFEALIGALGMYLSYQLLNTETTPALVWWLVWWAFLIGAWLVITGGLIVVQGWTDPKAEKERQIFAQSQNQPK